MPLTVSEEIMTKRGISSPAEDYEAAGLSRPARAGLLAVAVGVLLSAGCASNDLSGSATAPKKAEDLQIGRLRSGGPFATGASRPLGSCCWRVAVRRLREQRSEWISHRAKKSRRSSSGRLPASC